MVVGYKILYDNSIGSLERQVVKLMKEGWVPAGGIATSKLDRGGSINKKWFYQAMQYSSD